MKLVLSTAFILFTFSCFAQKGMTKIKSQSFGPIKSKFGYFVEVDTVHYIENSFTDKGKSNEIAILTVRFQDQLTALISDLENAINNIDKPKSIRSELYTLRISNNKIQVFIDHTYTEIDAKQGQQWITWLKTIRLEY